MSQPKRVVWGFWMLLMVSAAIGRAEPQSAEVPDGKLSSVHLIEIASANPDRPWPELSGAPDGLRFILLIQRKPGVPGKFTFRELRDFEIDGRSYGSATLDTSGKSYEPQTIIWDLRKFTKKRPDLASRIPTLGEGDAVVMETTIAGKALPRAGRCDVTLEVGWSSTERFAFSRELAKVPRSVPRAD